MARDFPSIPLMPWIRQSLTNGLSANESLRQLTSIAHEQGLTGIRRGTFLQLFRETKAARETYPEAIGLGQHELPEPPNIRRRSTETHEGYGTWVQVHFRKAGETQTVSEPWVIMSDHPLTPYEAEEQVGRLVADSAQRYNRSAVALNYIGTDQYTPGITP